MKITLIRPNYNSHIITPPLGIGYLASFLQREGIEATIIDGLKDSISNEEILKKVKVQRPDIVGITCLTAFYNETVDLSLLLKKDNFKVIIGGIHPTFLPFSTLKESNADFVLLGEGEIALTKLIKNNLSNKGIKGIYTINELNSDDDKLEKAENVKNLDDIPFPDWQQIDPNTYPKAPHGAISKNFPIGIITTTRGCPYECTFCASPDFYDRKIRYRSPGNVIKEIEHLVDKFGIKEIHFEDDNLTLKRDHIKEICDSLVEKNIKISWACPNGIRADKVDENLIKLMKKAGCYYFAYGIESANPTILENIKKREDIATIEESIRLADKYNISCQGFFVFGLPGETKQTIEETINFAKRTKLSRAQFLILDVIPGSELWCGLKGKFTPNWSKNSYKEPEWIPDGLTKEDLSCAQARAFRAFYFRPFVFFKLLRMVKLDQIKFLLKRLVEYRIIK